MLRLCVRIMGWVHVWDHALRSCVEIMCWDHVLRWWVEMMRRDDALRSCVKIMFWDHVLRSCVEIMYWDEALRFLYCVHILKFLSRLCYEILSVWREWAWPEVDHDLKSSMTSSQDDLKSSMTSSRAWPQDHCSWSHLPVLSHQVEKDNQTSIHNINPAFKD